MSLTVCSRKRLQTPEFAERVSHVKGGRTQDQPLRTEEDPPELPNSEECWQREVSRKPDRHRGRSLRGWFSRLTGNKRGHLERAEGLILGHCVSSPAHKCLHPAWELDMCVV